ncbi:MAG: hypothetical protein Kow00117_02770 [Phototrophicales bacterium]
MRFTLYTERTVSQCIKDLQARLEQKGTKSRPELDGWIKKGGDFSIAVTTKVAGRFAKTTRLSGSMERDKGVTIIEGYVSDGVSPFWLMVLAILLLVVCGVIFASGERMLAMVVFVLGLAAYIPLRGDYINSDILLIEVEKTLKASPKPPKITQNGGN